MGNIAKTGQIFYEVNISEAGTSRGIKNYGLFLKVLRASKLLVTLRYNRVSRYIFYPILNVF